MDIIKILCYVYKYINEITIKNIIISIISKYDDNEKVKSIYNHKSCYLQYINEVGDKEEAIPIDKYSLYFNDTFGILFRIFNRVLPKYDYSKEKIELDNSFTCNKDFIDIIFDDDVKLKNDSGYSYKKSYKKVSVRNRKTGRCKSKLRKKSKSCKKGSVRNRLTVRCKSKLRKKSKSCKKGFVRNRLTGRCKSKLRKKSKSKRV